MTRTRWRRSGVLLASGLVLIGLPAAVRLAQGGPAVPNRADEPAAAALAKIPSQRQVTALAILAVPGSSELDARLAAVQEPLRKVLPGYGFRLREVQSKRIGTGQSIVCDLGEGYQAQTVLVRALDDDGKVHLRCNLTHDGIKAFSTLIRAPVNQLVFYERSLKPGLRVLIGVGAR